MWKPGDDIDPYALYTPQEIAAQRREMTEIFKRIAPILAADLRKALDLDVRADH